MTGCEELRKKAMALTRHPRRSAHRHFQFHNAALPGNVTVNEQTVVRQLDAASQTATQ
jgi:hypothetical protein